MLTLLNKQFSFIRKISYILKPSALLKFNITNTAFTLTQRQIEILCILTLCPEGINLEELHYALYGDRPVSTTTLKAELSTQKLNTRRYRVNHIDLTAKFNVIFNGRASLKPWLSHQLRLHSIEEVS